MIEVECAQRLNECDGSCVNDEVVQQLQSIPDVHRVRVIPKVNVQF